MKRVVPVISLKGGVGKSTFSRGLVDVARSAGIATAAYDADGGVGQLLAHYGQRDANGSLMRSQDAAKGVDYFDVRDEVAREMLVNVVDAKADLVVIDLPGGSIDAIRTVRGVAADRADIQAPTVRQISVPTTIAGGEFSAGAGVTNTQTRVKEALRHRLAIPRAVVLDPAITLHTPEWLFLSTGIRAVDHCVEGLCSQQAHPYADAQATKGLSMLTQALPRVKADPENLDARMDCQIGTWLSMGGSAAGVPMGASHGIGYVLGAAYDVPHGYTSCVMLPAVMRWNRSANAERQALVAAAMGQPGEDAADVLDDFIRGLGLPRSLRDVRIGPEDFDRVAQQAMATTWIPRNPRQIDGPAQVREILMLAA